MRLIDADKLIKSIESDRNCSDMPSQWIDGVNYAIDLIDLYEPTIDIVRCGECKRRKPSGYVGSVKTYECDITGFRMHDLTNHFCSYGEREGE